MKKMSVVLVSLMVVACSSTPKADTPQASAKDSAPVSTANADSGKGAVEAQASQAQSVYFELDKSVVAHDGRELVQKQAEFIRQHKNDVVTVVGNCDERGSDEYNLALGQRRADTVKKLLEASGVRAKRIKTVTLGKEKPRLSCHEEKCWKENRRADFEHSA